MFLVLGYPATPQEEKNESVTPQEKNEESATSQQDKPEGKSRSADLLQYSKNLVSSVMPGQEKTEGNKESATSQEGNKKLEFQPTSEKPADDNILASNQKQTSSALGGIGINPLRCKYKLNSSKEEKLVI